ncbi:hypothetical protein [Peribacillus acanthi]|uniref:hypothetical protein n=1 Tax=Peribacillus acanthi TaxID=2171554 RepID=UPI001300A3BD|nr:hypothetical protein [Peribacillus acanthi]
MMNIRIKEIPEADKYTVFGWWYYSRVGEEFELIKTEGPPKKSEIYYLVKDGDDKKHVKIAHAEVVW